ncbi:hypothetical protein CAEBREN_04670 [Caenorhabditis brenneri]|uniref:Uncharacterized protein n=1 Tax=Caenorhabditis brenneri TaxID=135651 RepID=G0NZK7_CAEBE|nr:hypothetical protein CAEBREN_04670 [Caenorhabditis brenneri]
MPQYFGQRAGRIQTHTSVSTGSLDATQVNALLDVPVPNLEVNKVKSDFTAWKDKYQARYWPFCRYILDRAESGLSDYLNKCEQKERNRQHLTRIHNFLVMSEEMQRDIWQMNLWKDRKRKFVWPVDDDAPDDNGEMDMEVDDVDFENHHAAVNDVAMGEEIGTAPLVVTQESAAANGQAYDEKRSEFDVEEYREQVSRIQKKVLFRFLGGGAISGRKPLEAEVVDSPDNGSSRSTFLSSLREQLIRPAPLFTADWHGPDPNDRSISSTPPPLPEHYSLAQSQQSSANTISSPTSQEQEVVDGSKQMHVSVVSSRQQVKKFKRATTLEMQPTAKRLKTAEELEFDKEEYREQVSGFQKTALVRFLGGGVFARRKPVEMERLQGVVSPDNGSSGNTSTNGGTQNDRLTLLRNQAIIQQEEAEARVRAQRAADQVLMARILEREYLAVKRMTTVDKPNDVNYFSKDRTRPPLFTADGRWNGPDPNAPSTSSAPPPLQERYYFF